MRIIGMMAARNEDWCIGLTLRAALLWCDAVVVLDHASTDRTAAIIDEVMDEAAPGRVVSRREEGPWNEMAHRNYMLDVARRGGGTHFAIIDADEILTGNLLESVRLMFAEMSYGVILQLPGYNLRNSIGQYHKNGVWGNRTFSLGFAEDPILRWPEAETFHHREPAGRVLRPFRPVPQGAGGIMHLWGASYRRLVAKHRLYRVTERVKWPEKSVTEIEHTYSLAEKGDPSNAAYGTPETWVYAGVPESWWGPYQGLMQHLTVETEPWQNAEADRIIAGYGRSFFDGLTI